LTDEEQHERLTWFKDVVLKRSPWLMASVLGFVEFLNRPLRDEDIARFEEESGDSGGDDDLQACRVMTIAAQFFFIGWDVRGAVDEGDQLKRMTD
jgi:hypothetical protein